MVTYWIQEKIIMVVVHYTSDVVLFHYDVQITVARTAGFICARSVLFRLHNTCSINLGILGMGYL